MQVLNLKELYDFLYEDEEIEVLDEVYNVFEIFKKAEEAYKSKLRYHKAFYSLDCNDGIENAAIHKEKTPAEILLDKERNEELIERIFALPEKQAKRIYSHFYLGMSMNEIAEIEHVNRSSINKSILLGLKNLRNIKSTAHY